MSIAIIDYGAGNVRSVQNMLGRIGAESMITSDHDQLRSASKLILPSVGHFKYAMDLNGTILGMSRAEITKRFDAIVDFAEVGSFLDTPVIWPIHDVPYDEYRYTPFSLARVMQRAGFAEPVIEATGGRHAALAVMTGLWVRRRALTSRVHVVTKTALSFVLWPIVWWLSRIDERPSQLGESTLLVGLSATARKAL